MHWRVFMCVYVWPREEGARADAAGRGLIQPLQCLSEVYGYYDHCVCVCVCVCMSVWGCKCIFLYLLVCICACVFLCLSVLSVCLSVCLSVHVPTIVHRIFYTGVPLGLWLHVSICEEVCHAVAVLDATKIVRGFVVTITKPQDQVTCTVSVGNPVSRVLYILIEL